MARGPTIVRPPGADYHIKIVGDRPAPLRDLYHALLRRSWGITFALISAAFLAVNAVFAALYLATGGVSGAAAGSYADAFFFSVQTLGTIGYGAFYPAARAAHVLVVAESIVGLILTALSTGLVFAKFSRPTARVVFSRAAVVGPHGGKPTLSVRIGNQRGNSIVDAQIRVALVRTERLAEGGVFYRMLDLPLSRERAFSLSRSWTVLHTIGETSPLAGMTEASAAEQEIELQIMVVGIDDTTMQTVHARHQYPTRDIVWGARHVDILSETPDGGLLLDLRKFHDVERLPG